MHSVQNACVKPDLLLEATAVHEAAHAAHAYAIQGRSLLELEVRPKLNGRWTGRVRALGPPVDDFQEAVGLLLGRYASLQYITGVGPVPDFLDLIALDRLATAMAAARPHAAGQLLRCDDVRAARAILRAAEHRPWSSHQWAELDVYCAVCSSLRAVCRGLERAICAVAAELMKSQHLSGHAAMQIIDLRLGFSDGPTT